ITGCDPWADGWRLVWRFATLEAALAELPKLRRRLNTFSFYLATGADAQRKHVGCDWWCLPPWRERGERRPRAWSGRYDPKRRAAYFAKLYGDEPDVERARRAILARCRKCADCRREAGEDHIRRLERQEAEDLSLAELLEMPLDQIK